MNNIAQWTVLQRKKNKNNEKTTNKKTTRYFKQSILLNRPSICPIFFYIGKAHSIFSESFQLSINCSSFCEPYKTSLYISSPHWSQHNLQQPCKKPSCTAQDNSTGTNQNTFGRQVNISLLWFQATCQIERIPGYILLNNISEQTEAS